MSNYSYKRQYIEDFLYAAIVWIQSFCRVI